MDEKAIHWVIAPSGITRTPPHPSEKAKSMTIGPGEHNVADLQAGLAKEAAQQGARFNQGKSRLNLVPASFGRYAAAGLGYGALKYEAHNWRKGFNWSEVMESLQRHLDAFKEGEDIDNESRLPHLALAACNLAFLIEFYDKNRGNDDRFRYPDQPVGAQLPGRVLTFRQPPVQHDTQDASGPGAGDDEAAPSGAR